MNIEGYSSDSDSSGSSDLKYVPDSKGEVAHGLESRHSVVTTSGVINTFGGCIQKVIAVPKVVPKRKIGGGKPNRKKSRQTPAEVDFEGPWGASETSEDSCLDQTDSGEDQEDITNSNESNTIDELEEKTKTVTKLYSNVSFTDPNSGDSILNDSKSRYPKKVCFTLPGHPKGVTRIRLVPKLGHLLLSCGNDGKIYLWSLIHEANRRIRGYFGHSLAVKDVIFSASGEKFLSCSYDNTVVLWETATGAIIKRINVQATPNCAMFNPINENEIVIGLANRKIEHYDLLSSDSPVQTYDQHLGAIISLAAVSDSVFISTSDDRTVRLWKWHINIPVKIIADPTQHAIPCVAIHPTSSFIALQSMDDTIYVCQAGGKYRYNKKKTFRGHKVAGYGVDVTYSKDGDYMISGDVGGHVFIWSWKDCKVVQKINLGDDLISCVAAHPVKQNVLAAAGRKGEIYICV